MSRILILLGLSSIVSLVQSQCSGGIPASEVGGFLDVHNRLRRTISDGNYVARGRRMPAARSPIPNLSWDCEIERSAQRVANTCVFAHSTNRNNLGENLYAVTSSAVVSINGQGRAASAAWEKEFQDYGWPNVQLTMAVFNSGIGHATQMAWARSTRIGCGMARCQGGRQVIVVCQYRDAGNFINQNVYEPR